MAKMKEKVTVHNHHLMRALEVPDEADQWVRMEHPEMDLGPSEAPPKPSLGAMEPIAAFRNWRGIRPAISR